MGTSSPLICAVKGGHTGVVKLLAQHGVEPNWRNTSGATALHMAVISSTPEMARLLLAMGCDPTIQDHHGCTPQALALRLNKPEFTPIFARHSVNA